MNKSTVSIAVVVGTLALFSVAPWIALAVIVEEGVVAWSLLGAGVVVASVVATSTAVSMKSAAKL